MTKKDYELIAFAIRAQINGTNQEIREFGGEQAKEYGLFNRVNGMKMVAWSIADDLQAENPRFDRVKFLNACGIETLAD